MKKKFAFLIILIFVALNTYAQELPPIKYFSPSEYGAGNQNWMIAESQDHKIFIANNKGLLVYNGSQWSVYKTPNESIMRSVKMDKDRVYTGCYMDFGYWDLTNTGDYTYTSLVESLGLKLQEDEQFWEIIVKKDYILFQSLSNIYLYDKIKNQLSNIVSNATIQKFYDVDNSFYYQELGDGLYQVLNGTSELLNDSLVAQKKLIIKMFNHLGTTYVVTDDASIYQLIEGELIFYSELGYESPVTVYSAQVLNDGSLLLGTISSGVISCNLKGVVNYNINQNSGLGNNTCLSIFQDSKSNIWLGLDNGISCVNDNSPYLIYKDRDGKLGTVYASASYNNRVYIGTNQGLFSKAFEDEEFVFIEGSAGQVWSLSVIDETLFCGHNLGLFVLRNNRLDLVHNTGTWQVKPFNDKDGLILAGSYKGVYVIEKINKNWVHKSNLEGFDISSKDLVLESDTSIFVNHEYKGVFRLELNQELNKILSKQLVPELSKGIGSDIVSYDGVVFFAKRDSVFTKKRNESTFNFDPLLSDLFKATDYTSASLEVAGDYLWTFNKSYVNKIEFEDINGNYKIEKIKYPITTRMEKTGYENITEVAPNTYLIGASFGYSLFNSSDYTNQEDIKVFISGVSQKVNNQTKSLSLTDPVTINFKGCNIDISYAVNNYNALRAVEFQHRLLKNNEVVNNWSEWTTNNEISFESLRYGEYDFEVRFKKNDESLSESAKFSFTVGRPYYLTNTAIIIYIVLSVLLVAMLNGFYIWYFKRQKKRALEKQQKELELQNLTNEKNIIELRNAKLRSDIEHRNRELAVSTMAMIKKNETLNELKNELKKLPKDTATISLKKMVDKNLNSKQDWITFEEAFNNADKDFFKKVKEKHPSLSSGDLRLCVYLRLNLSSKEIAPLLNISPRSVEIKRYRLRKKLGLTRNDSLTSYIVEI